jgi:DNA-binding NarL/FixJ family response regulator
MCDSIKIIIAEDHYWFRKAIVDELIEHGILPIGEAENGIELLRHLETKSPDVILLDLEMPEMDGNKTLATLSQKFPDVKVIILSQHDEEGLIDNYIKRGVKGYLPKRFVSSNIKILAEGIKDVYNCGHFYYAYDPSNSKIKYSRREIEIIPLLYACKTSKEIGAEVGIPEKRINKVRDKLYKKTKSRNSTEFLKYCIEKGLRFLGK